jgi:hypothetical protein
MRQIAMALPPPKLWQEFEELTRDVIRFAFNDPGATNYGNQGAPQHGVDVYGRENARGRLIGIQCKRSGKTDSAGRMLPGGLKVSQLAAEIGKAKGFAPRLERYIVATTAFRQKAIQDEERKLNEMQIKSGSFTFEVWFWDDFLSYLHKYAPLLQWYYTRVLQMTGVYSIDHQILYLFHMAFSRPAFSTGLSMEESGPALFDALKDTITALNTGQLQDRETRGLIRAAPGGIGMLSNDQWRIEIERAAKMVSDARSVYQQARKERKIIEYPDGLRVLDSTVAHDLDTLRGDAIRALNSVLQSAGLPEVVSTL